MKDSGNDVGSAERILNYGGWAHKRAPEALTCKVGLEESSPKKI